MDFVLVIFDRNVDFPTEGNPTRAIRASPDFDTSNPLPPPPPAPGPGSRSCARSLASFLNALLAGLLVGGNGELTLLEDQGGILLEYVSDWN